LSRNGRASPLSLAKPAKRAYLDALNDTTAWLPFIFFIDCAVSAFALNEFVSAASVGWLAIKAFFTVGRLLINDFF
jgi:hypothetical protein